MLTQNKICLGALGLTNTLTQYEQSIHVSPTPLTHQMNRFGILNPFAQQHQPSARMRTIVFSGKDKAELKLILGAKIHQNSLSLTH